MQKTTHPHTKNQTKKKKHKGFQGQPNKKTQKLIREEIIGLLHLEEDGLTCQEKKPLSRKENQKKHQHHKEHQCNRHQRRETTSPRFGGVEKNTQWEKKKGNHNLGGHNKNEKKQNTKGENP